MAEDLKRQIAISVEGSGVEAGVESAKASLRSLGDTARKVGTDAGQGLSGIGPAVEQSSRKVEATTKNLVGAIERTTAAMEAGQRGTRAYYEALANQRGVDVNALKPYLDQLDAVTAKQKAAAAALDATSQPLERVGMSAKQTAAALRGVPAQFTDIFTSLAAGQQPLTVFLQQGGQLKDMFGGAAPAAKALGGYIAGLVTPFTAAAAAIGGIAYVLSSANDGIRELNRTLIVTGGAAGTTAQQLSAMAERLGRAGGGYSAAVEALNAVVKSGAAAGEEVERVGRVTMNVAKITGDSVQDIAKSIASLQDDPMKAAAKLNESFAFLTAETVRSAQAFAMQGDKAEATRVILESLAGASDTARKALVDNAGLAERAWDFLLGKLRQVKENILSIGREQTAAQQIAQQEARVAFLRQEAGSSLFGGKGTSNALTEAEAVLAGLRKEAAEREKVAAATAQQKAAAQERTQGEIEYGRIAERNAGNQIKRIREIAEANEAFKKSGRADLTGEARVAADKQHAQVLAEINKKYQERAGGVRGATAATNDLIRAQAQQIKNEQQLADVEAKRYRALIEHQVRMGNRTATEGIEEIGRSEIADYDKRIDRLKQEIDILGKKKNTHREIETLQGEISKAQQERDSREIKLLQDLEYAEQQRLDKQRAFYNEAYNSSIKELDGLREKNEASAREIDAIGKTSKQLAELTKARIDDTIRAKEQKIAAMEVFASDGDKSIIDAEKDKLEELRRSRELIDRKAVADSAAAAQAEWTKLYDDLNRGLTDSIYRSFESGKDFGKTFIESIKNLAKTTLLRFAVQFVTGGSGGVLGGSSGGVLGGGSGGGVLDMANNASSLYSAYTKAPQYWNQFSNWLAGGATTYAAASGALAGGAGSGLVTMGGTAVNTGLGYGAVNFGGSSVFGGAAAEGFGYGAGSAATFSSSAATGAAASEAAAAGGAAAAGEGAVAGLSATGWGVIAAAAILAVMYFTSKGGGPKTEAGAGFGIPDPMKRGDTKSAETISKGISDSYGELAKQLGITNQKLDVGVFYAKDPIGDSPTQLQVVAGLDGQEVYRRAKKGTNSEFDPTFENVGRSDEELQKAVAEATTRAIYEGIKASDLGQKYKDWLQSQEDITKPQRDAQAAAGGIDMELLRKQFGDLAEQMAENMRLTGQTNMPGGAAAQEDAAVLQQRLATLQAIKGFDDALAKLPFEPLKNLAVDTSLALIQAAGGMDALNAKLTSYYENYYTDAERTAVATKALGVEFSKIGQTMPATREQMRQMVEEASKHVDTEAGRKTYDQLLLLSQAFAQITPPIDDAALSADAFRKALKGLPFTELADLSDDARKKLIELAGGMESLSGALTSYYQNYYSDAERTALSTQQMTEQFQALGLALPNSRDELRAMIEQAQKLASTSDDAMAFYVALLKLSDAFKDLVPATNAAAEATAQPTGPQYAPGQYGVNVGDLAVAEVQRREQERKAAEDARKFAEQLAALPFDHLSGMAAEARDALLQAAGGMDAFTSKLQSYQQNFFAQGDKTQQQVDALRSQFAALGEELPGTKEAFVAMVDGAAAAMRAAQQRAADRKAEFEQAQADPTMGGAAFRDLRLQYVANAQADTAAAEAARQHYLALLDLQQATADVLQVQAEAHAALQTWRDTIAALPFAHLATLSDSARDALFKLAGGVDNLAASLQGYYANFYTDAERSAIATQQLTAQFDALGFALPKTREAFRALVDGAAQDTSESGLRLYAALLKLQGAFADLVPAATQAAETVQEGWRATNADGSVNVNQADLFAAERQRAEEAAKQAKDWADLLRSMPFDYLSQMTDRAKDSLIEMAGGLQNLSTKLNSFAQNYYSDAERTAQQTKMLATQFAALGVAMPQTREEFRKLVEDAAARLNDLPTAVMPQQLDWSGAGPSIEQIAAYKEQVRQYLATQQASEAAAAAGRTQYNALLDLADAFAKITETAGGMTAAMKAIDEAMTRVQRAASAEKRIYEAQRDAAAEIVNATKGVFDTLKSAVADLYGETQDGAAAAAREGRAFISNALSNAQATGYLPEQADLAKAINDVRKGLSADSFSSREDMDRQRLILAGQLDTLREMAGAQLEPAQAQLEAANAQLKALDELVKNAQYEVEVFRDINSGVHTVADAIAALHAALAEGRAGLSPADQARLDAIDAQARTDALAQSTQPAQTGVVTVTAPPVATLMIGSTTLENRIAALLAEVQQLRQDNSAENRAIASSTGNTARLLDRVIPEGDAVQTRAIA